MSDASYNPSEQDEILDTFREMLQSVTKDGGQKRAAGLKPSWKEDTSHEPAVFSHWNKYKHGELVDEGSGTHPLVHGAWRMLALAWQDMKREPYLYAGLLPENIRKDG